MKNSKKQSITPSKESKNKIHVVITSSGMILTESDFRKINISDLVITHTNYIGQEKYTKTIKLWKKIEISGKKYYVLARSLDLQKISGNLVTKRNKMHPGKSINENKMEPGVTLTSNQQLIFDYLLENIYNQNNIESGSAGCIFVMDTGLGKTYMGGAFIGFHKKKTLIITPKIPAFKEWMKMLNSCFPKLDIGVYNSKTKKDGDVVIMTVNSALKDVFIINKNKVKYHDYFKEFGSVIMDEVHNYSTEKRQEIFWRTNFMYPMGLTATPDERNDGMDPVAESHLGRIVRAAEIPNYNIQEVQWIGKIKAIRYSGPPEFTKKEVNDKGWVSTQKMCEQFIADPYRNQLILEYINKLLNSNKNIYIFSERREYLKTLKQKIFEAGMISYCPELGDEVSVMMGGITEEEEIKANESKIILITYGYGVESISIARMDSILFATPRKAKMRQTLGRILRRGGDPTIERIVIDIIDDETSLRKQFDKRKIIYKEKDFPIKEKIISYKKYGKV